jgi:dTDP-glucose pyrophosphorylase
MLMCADDLHGAPALAEALSHPLSILVSEHAEPWKFGVVELHDDRTMAGIVEKPEHPSTNLISTGAMVLDTRIFDYDVARHESGEYFMTYPLNLMAKEHPIAIITQDLWIPVGYPEDIPGAEARLIQSSVFA